MSNQNHENMVYCENCESFQPYQITCANCGSKIEKTKDEILMESIDSLTDIGEYTKVEDFIDPEIKSKGEVTLTEVVEATKYPVDPEYQDEFLSIYDDPSKNLKSALVKFMHNRMMKDVRFVVRELDNSVLRDVTQFRSDALKWRNEYNDLQMAVEKASQDGELDKLEYYKGLQSKLISKLRNNIFYYTTKSEYWNGIVSIKLLDEFFKYVSKQFKSLCDEKKKLQAESRFKYLSEDQLRSNDEFKIAFSEARGKYMDPNDKPKFEKEHEYPRFIMSRIILKLNVLDEKYFLDIFAGIIGSHSYVTKEEHDQIHDTWNALLRRGLDREDVEKFLGDPKWIYTLAGVGFILFDEQDDKLNQFNIISYNEHTNKFEKRFETFAKGFQEVSAFGDQHAVEYNRKAEIANEKKMKAKEEKLYSFYTKKK